MTDTTIPSIGSLVRRRPSPEEQQARVKRRYRAEARFRYYGLAALVMTSIFVIAVLVDIVLKGLPAFTQHSLVLDVPIKAEDVDPQATRDPEVIRTADFFTLSRNALRGAVPGVEGRLAKKKLDGLLSTGASNELRNMLMADPALVGQSVKARFLLSDDADLYLKGTETNVVTAAGRGAVTPSGTKDDVRLLSSSNDFAEALVALKLALAARVEELRTQLRRAERGGEAEAARAQALRDEIAALEARYTKQGVEEQLDDRMPSLLVAMNGGLIKLTKIGNAEADGTVVLPLSSADEAQAGKWQLVTYVTPESNRKVSDLEIAFLEKLRAEGKIERHFNTLFFTSGDSREAELAGILGSLTGSILMLIVTISLCVPVGVIAAVYLEEFAPKNWFTDIIEININNLAAVPSIVFGLLGLAVFLNFFGLPRSAPLVGGLVLALLVLPTIIIAARAALKAVPPSIKEAALGVGASHQQAVFHHVLPLAMPGIMTGTIIGMAHALGETAPLLMIGMLAFVVDIPHGFFDSATALPAQIYIWSDLPEQAFQAKTAAAIMILLLVLFSMNGVAIWLRKRFERRW
jgi:phosphate transport system permease protein